MGEFLFGSGTGRISKRLGNQIDRIAREHGAWFVSPEMPEGHRYWFACENRGEASNRATQSAVEEALKAAGIRLPK